MRKIYLMRDIIGTLQERQQMVGYIILISKKETYLQQSYISRITLNKIRSTGRPTTPL